MEGHEDKDENKIDQYGPKGGIIGAGNKCSNGNGEQGEISGEIYAPITSLFLFFVHNSIVPFFDLNHINLIELRQGLKLSLP